MRLLLAAAPTDADAIRDKAREVLAREEFDVSDYQQESYLGKLGEFLSWLWENLVAFSRLLEGLPTALRLLLYAVLIALLVLLIWHMYGAHLSPEVFPMNKSIFTGYLDVRDLRERHALEYERVFPDGPPRPPTPGAATSAGPDAKAEGAEVPEGS